MDTDPLKDYISTKDASERFGIGQEYLAYLASHNIINGIKVARNWLLYVPALEQYVKNRPKRGPKPRNRSRK